ncbi:MAG: ABC transporter permease [Xenococcaceae cyanobacterium]
MHRYLKLLNLFWSTSIAAELEYRLNFLIASLSSLANLAGSIFSLFLFYRTGYTFEGWNWQQAMLVLGVFTLLQGFSATFLVPNLNRIVDQVQKGTLDFVLLKPIDSQFWVSARSVSPWGVPDLLFGAIIIIYAGSGLGFSFKNYIQGAIPIASGFIILYSLWFMLGSTSIWFVKIYNVTEVLRGFLEAGRYPLIAYPASYRVFFTFVIPVAFLTTVPAEAMLDRAPNLLLGGSVLLAISLFFVAKYFWKFALRFYTSASS